MLGFACALSLKRKQILTDTEIQKASFLNSLYVAEMHQKCIESEKTDLFLKLDYVSSLCLQICNNMKRFHFSNNVSAQNHDTLHMSRGENTLILQ